MKTRFKNIVLHIMRIKHFRFQYIFYVGLKKKTFNISSARGIVPKGIGVHEGQVPSLSFYHFTSSGINIKIQIAGLPHCYPDRPLSQPKHQKNSIQELSQIESFYLFPSQAFHAKAISQIPPHAARPPPTKTGLCYLRTLSQGGRQQQEQFKNAFVNIVSLQKFLARGNYLRCTISFPLLWS